MAVERMPEVILPDGTDEDVIAFAISHYFFPQELIEAQRMLEQGTPYKEVIAALASHGMETLRDSSSIGDSDPPHFYMTIPGGKVFVYHPQRRYPQRPLLVIGVAHLASLAFPAPIETIEAQELTPPLPRRQPSLFEEPVAEAVERSPEKSTSRQTRTKKVAYIESRVRVGTKKRWTEYPGWVVKRGGLGYAIEELRRGGYFVRLVHLGSNRRMAMICLSCIDEDTHARIRAWIAEVLPLTDWSRGISTILKEKEGEHKQRDWERQIEFLWLKYKLQPRQCSLFDLGEL